MSSVRPVSLCGRCAVNMDWNEVPIQGERAFDGVPEGKVGKGSGDSDCQPTLGLRTDTGVWPGGVASGRAFAPSEENVADGPEEVAVSTARYNTKRTRTIQTDLQMSPPDGRPSS